MLDKIRYCYIDPEFNVSSRLTQLKEWQDEFQLVDGDLLAKMRESDPNTEEGDNISTRISRLRSRITFLKVRQPISLPETIGWNTGVLAQFEKNLYSQYMKLTQDDRLFWLHNLNFIMTKDLHEANKKIDKLLQEDTEHRRGMLLYGDSRMGKT